MTKEEFYKIIKQVNKDAYVVVTWSERDKTKVCRHRVTDIKISLLNNTLELSIDDC